MRNQEVYMRVQPPSFSFFYLPCLPVALSAGWRRGTEHAAAMNCGEHRLDQRDIDAGRQIPSLH